MQLNPKSVTMLLCSSLFLGVIYKANKNMFKAIFILLLFSVLFAESGSCAQATSSLSETTTATHLQAINLNEVPKWNAPYEFRIASFSRNEGAYGSGVVILLLSNDLRTAYINLQGVTTELKSVQKNPSTSCRSGEVRQSVYANAELRLMLKVSLEPGEEACWAKGVVSLHLNKHTYRYMVKGVSGL